MSLSVQMVASEILMVGLKQIPIVGPAIEVVDGIHKRYESAVLEERINTVETQLRTLDCSLRDVQAKMQETIKNLMQPDLDGPAFSAFINALKAMKAQGWSPALFQGLLEQSVHWTELCRDPSNYGTVLADQQSLDPNKMHVFIDADKPRVLELTPFALHALLSRQRDDIPNTKMVGKDDVWAFRDFPGKNRSRAHKPTATTTPSQKVKSKAGSRKTSTHVDSRPIVGVSWTFDKYHVKLKCTRCGHEYYELYEGPGGPECKLWKCRFSCSEWPSSPFEWIWRWSLVLAGTPFSGYGQIIHQEVFDPSRKIYEYA